MYQHDKFGSTYQDEGGREIWAFLHEEANIIRMETASYLSRPAIEALSPFLLSRFGETIKKDRIKQMMGHMVRQIMEARGYRLQQSNVKIVRLGNIFSRASRYVKNEENT